MLNYILSVSFFKKKLLGIILLQAFVYCNGWTVQIVSEINGWGLGEDFIVDDTANFLGVDLLATDEYDSDFDIPDPPVPVGNYIRFYFPHYDWDNPFDENEFTQDIRFQNESLLNGDGIIWQGELFSNMEGETSLFFIINQDFNGCQIEILLDNETNIFSFDDTVFTYLNAFEEKSVLITIGSCNYYENTQIDLTLASYSPINAFPNPFNGIINVKYTLFSAGFVVIETYNLNGQKISNGLNFKEFKPSGEYTIRWNPKNLNSGNYFLFINANNNKYYKQITLLK